MNSEAATIYSIFMLLKTTNAWLALKPKDRFQFMDENIWPIVEKYPEVKIRYFDAEAFNASYSDIILWETSNLQGYQAIVEQLRETLFWGHYFDVAEIVPTLENAYANYYNARRPSQ